MSKLLIKRIIGLVGSIATLISVLFINVGITLTDGKDISNPINKNFFAFIGEYRDSYYFARFTMIFSFILICICVVYFLSIFILSIIGKKELGNKLKIITMIYNFVIIGSVFLLLVAGLDKESVFGGTYTNNISLVGFPWALSLLFSFVPLIGDYFVKE